MNNSKLQPLNTERQLHQVPALCSEQSCSWTQNSRRQLIRVRDFNFNFNVQLLSLSLFSTTRTPQKERDIHTLRHEADRNFNFSFCTLSVDHFHLSHFHTFHFSPQSHFSKSTSLGQGERNLRTNRSRKRSSRHCIL